MIIKSPDNALVRRLKRLAGSARECREQGRTLIEGEHLLQAALQSRVALHTLVLCHGDVSAEMRALAGQVDALPGVKSVVLSPALYGAISPVAHGSGVAAEIGIPRTSLPDRIAEDSVYLDGVQDPGNVGTVLRTAARRVRRPRRSGLRLSWSPQLRAGMGAHFVLGLHEDVSPETIGRVFAGTILAADAASGDDLYS
jgi:TrmH family RNA methyltransferase